jgi:hypothetical protein
LFLFIGFYLSTYKGGPAKPAAKEAVRRASVCEVPKVTEMTAPTVDVMKFATQKVTEVARTDKLSTY